MSPQTAHSCDGDGGVGPLEEVGWSTEPPGELAAEEQAEADGGGPASLSFGLSLLLVDSDRCSGKEARLCLGLKAVLT